MDYCELCEYICRNKWNRKVKSHLYDTECISILGGICQLVFVVIIHNLIVAVKEVMTGYLKNDIDNLGVYQIADTCLGISESVSVVSVDVVSVDKLNLLYLFVFAM